MKPNTVKTLSIQIRLSGLSFCILNKSSHTIEYLEFVPLDKNGTPYELLSLLKTTIEENTVFNQDFDNVLCIHQNEMSTLVPKPLFDENLLADYLKFNAKILKSDYLNYDEIKSNDSYSVYVPWVNINNYIFDIYGSFSYKHASTILIDTILEYPSKHNDTELFINVDKQHFEIIARQNSKLLLYNSFNYNTPQDFIYYILFTFEQLRLDPETIPVYLSGYVDQEDELYSILYKYIRHVEFTTLIQKYRFKDQEEDSIKNTHFLILNSFN